MKDIVIIGASGFGKEISWLIEEINKENKRWNILGYVDDDKSKIGYKVNNYDVFGTVDWLLDKELNVVIAIADPIIRREIASKLKDTANDFPNLIHPNILKSESIEMGKGIIIAANSIVTVDIEIGNFVIIDRNCNIGHDTKINEMVTILPSSTISGNVTINQGVFIGTGAVVIQGLTVGMNSTIGAGAVAVSDIPNNCVVVGVPAKPIKYYHENN